MAQHDRRGTGGLEPPHPRPVRGGAVGGVLGVAAPVSRDVACVAHGQAVDVRGVAQDVDHLERRRLLALDPGGVDAVDQLDGERLGQLARHPEAVVEVAVDLEQGRAVSDGLGQLAHGDLAVGHQDGAGDAGSRGVGGGRGRGVAGAGADDGLGTVGDGDRHGRGHAAVLERTGRVATLDLEPHLATQRVRQPAGVHQRGPALGEGDVAGAGGQRTDDRQAVSVLRDDSAPRCGHRLLTLLRRA